MRRMTAKTAARVPLLNRELGILAFNRRVLAQAADEAVPLLERLRFLTHRLLQPRRVLRDPRRRPQGADQARHRRSRAGRPDAEGDARDRDAARRARSSTQQFDLLNDELLPELAANGIRFLRRGDLERRPARLGARLLHARGDAGADADRPRPGASVPARLQQEPELRSSSSRAATPSAAARGSRSCRRRAMLPRVIRLPPNDRRGRKYSFVFLTSILHAHVGELFAGMNVKGCYQFRVTRNCDLFVDEEEVKNLRIGAAGRAAAAALRRRGAPRGGGRTSPVDDRSFLLQQFELDEQDLYHVDGPVNLVRLLSVLDRGRPAGPQVPGVRARGCRRRSKAGAGPLRRRIARGRHPAAPPVPVVHAGDRASSAQARATRAWSRSSRPSTAPAPTRS